MHTRWITLLVALLASRATAQESECWFVHGHVLDAKGEHWIDDAALLVRGAKIAELRASNDVAKSASAGSTDLVGAYVVPGLIDLHTHLALHPYDETPWNDQVLKESLELRTIRAVAQAKSTLDAGFTTIRELGTEGAGFVDVALRDAIAKNVVVGPRIFASTRAIVATGCYGPAGFDPRFEVPCGAEEATGVDEVRRAVREQIHAGADWIKVYADYRRAPGDVATPTFSLEELRAAVDEATSAHRRVAAHASTDEGVRRAVEAGVATIEHGYGATKLTLELMKQRGVVLCPTLAANEATARYSGWKDGEPPKSVVEARAMVKLARELGVTIACGSDAGVFAHGANARELELLGASGMSNAEVLRAATSIAAKVLGLERELGTLESGFTADFVAFRRDPLRDLSALREPLLVVRAGNVVFGKR